MRVDASLDALLADALASDYANTAPNQNSGRLRVFFIAGANAKPQDIRLPTAIQYIL